MSLYQALKARYFALCSFMVVQQKPNASYVWRRILEAQYIIVKRSSCKRIENKNHLRYEREGGDNWLSTPTTYRVAHNKSFVNYLTLFHAQSAWGFRWEIVRVARLVVYCNYLKKNKKRNCHGSFFYLFTHQIHTHIYIYIYGLAHHHQLYYKKHKSMP